MATYRAIAAISHLLKEQLSAALDGFTPTPAVVLASPRQFEGLESADTTTLSIFLYRVEENRDIRARARPELAAGKVRRPIALDLWYLITPWGKYTVGEEEAGTLESLELLGITTRTLASLAEFQPAALVSSDYAGVFAPQDDVQLILESLPIDDLYRVWDTSNVAFRLSLAYRARLVGIDIPDPPTAPPVIDAELHVARRP